MKHGKAEIKHGKVYKVYPRHRQHLTPIMKYVRRGLADAKEPIVLQPEACDVRGAKKYNGQQCVVARCLNRLLKPEAVAVGRAMAYAVFDGLAIRFFVNTSARRAVEEFDEKGRVKRAPIVLAAVPKSQLIQNNRRRGGTERSTGKHRRKFGIRAIGGGRNIRIPQEKRA